MAKRANCRCRKPKTHRDCSYCGTGVAVPEGAVCGVCRENGIDGPLIRGTGRVWCKAHRPAKESGWPKHEHNPKLDLGVYTLWERLDPHSEWQEICHMLSATDAAETMTDLVIESAEREQCRPANLPCWRLSYDPESPKAVVLDRPALMLSELAAAIQKQARQCGMKVRFIEAERQVCLSDGFDLLLTAISGLNMRQAMRQAIKWFERKGEEELFRMIRQVAHEIEADTESLGASLFDTLWETDYFTLQADDKAAVKLYRKLPEGEQERLLRKALRG